MSNLFQRTQGGVLDFFNMFSGGALERMSVIALGVMPYITAPIVIQLATSLSPTLGALKKEGESGRKKLNQFTRSGTVFLCASQGYGIAVRVEGWGAGQGASAVLDPCPVCRLSCVQQVVEGPMLLLCLGGAATPLPPEEQRAGR